MNRPNFVVQFELSGDPAIHMKIASRLSVRDGKVTLVGVERGDTKVFDYLDIKIVALRPLTSSPHGMAA